MIKSFLLNLLLAGLLLQSCEEIPNEVIDEQTKDYTVKKIIAPDTLTYNQNGTELITSVEVENKNAVNEIWFDVASVNNSVIITSGNTMNDNGTNGDAKKNDNIFTGKVKLDKNILSGKFEIVYYIEDNVRIKPDNIRKVGTKIFNYVSKADNEPPEISNLNMPDEINREDKFAFSLKVTDSNGLTDIDSVYYIVKNPGGTIVKNSKGIYKFPLYDDGAANHSDDIAGDGIFTTNLQFPTSASTGKWEFKFVAKDKGGLLSNTIIHKLNVK